MNDNELADRTHRTAEAWEKIADGRANDERLIVSGYQAHDTAQTLRLAAARLRELSVENEQLRALADAVREFVEDDGAGEEFPAPIDVKYEAVRTALAALGEES